MIQDLRELKKKKLDAVKSFIQECSITEKIDTYYVSVEVISKNNITFRKSSGKLIERTDMILNAMWDRLVSDWNYFRMVNAEWFEKHIGYKIHMFFFPCQTPIFTEYKGNVSYVIDRVMYDNEQFNPESLMWNMTMLDKFNIHFMHDMKKLDFNADEIANKIIAPDSDVYDIFENEIIDYKNSTLFASDRPEGFIIRKKKHIYQMNFDNHNRFVKSEKSQYEFLLMDFIKYWNSDSLWMMLDNSYIKTVCLLFNAYILNKESQTNHIKNNIETESIRSPYVGHRFDMNYKYIPDEMTISLCKDNELYANIFKILIVNLRHEKKCKNCVLMNSKNVEEWNAIVKRINRRCLFD